MAKNKLINVEVCYATKNEQEIIPLIISNKSTVLDAVQQSGILEKYKEIDLSKSKIGIHAKIVQLDNILEDMDRVEIYRELINKPIDARRQRAERQKIK